MNRRGFLTGIIAAAVAPAVIRTPGLIMPVRSIDVVRPGLPVIVLYESGRIEFTGFAGPTAGDTVTINGETFRFERHDLDRLTPWVPENFSQLPAKISQPIA